MHVGALLLCFEVSRSDFISNPPTKLKKNSPVKIIIKGGEYREGPWCLCLVCGFAPKPIITSCKARLIPRVGVWVSGVCMRVQGLGRGVGTPSRRESEHLGKRMSVCTPSFPLPDWDS